MLDAEMPGTYEWRGQGYPPGPGTLKRRLTVAQLLWDLGQRSARYLTYDTYDADGRVPWWRKLRLAVAAWESWVKRARPLIDSMQPGDEWWAYDYVGFMGPLSGAEGYFLVRNGLVVADLVGSVS